MKLDARARVHIVGVVVGALVTIWAAIQGDGKFAVAFAVATVVMAIGVLHRIRTMQDGG